MKGDDVYEIILSTDTPDGARFAGWLRAHGHDARVGDDTGDHIDGVWTSCSAGMSTIMRELWEEFCSSV